MIENRQWRYVIAVIAAMVLMGAFVTSSAAQPGGKGKPAADKKAMPGKGKIEKSAGKGKKAGGNEAGDDAAGDDQAGDDKAGEVDVEEHKQKAEEHKQKAEEFKKKAEELKAKGKARAAEKEAAKAAEHAAKAAEHAAKAAEHAAKADPRFARIKQQAKERRANRDKRAKELRDKARGRAKAALKGKPMDQALKQELRRHARRLARLNRILAVAAEAQNSEAVERATKLIAKEGQRHQRWMVTYGKEKGGQDKGQGGQK